MNATQLAVWLQGMFEYRDVSSIGHQECRNMLQGIKDHVALVFEKVTPANTWENVSGSAKAENNAEPEAEPKAKPKESVADILKRHKINPVFPQQPYNPFPGYPLPYAPSPNPLEPNKFWINGGPSVITC